MRRIAVLLGAALILGCGGSVGDPFITGGGNGGGPARVRFFHASADGPTLQLLLDGQPDLGEITFTSVTPYVDVSNPSVRLTLNSILLPGTPIIDTIVTLPDSSLTTVIAEGDTSAIHLRFVLDAQSVTGSVQLRVLDEAPASGSLDLYVTAPLADLATATPTVAGISFGTDTPYQVLAPATYQVRLTTAGSKTVVVDSGSLVLASGDVRTFVVLDADGGGVPLQAKVLVDAGT